MTFRRPSHSQVLSALIFVLFLALSGLGTWFHEPWSDELQAWLIARDLSIPAIWNIMAVEGHFMLWHLCILPLAKSGLPPESMCWLAWCLNAFTGWMMLYRTQLPRWCRILMLFSAPMLYFYATTARPYVLLPPLLLLTLNLYAKRDTHPYLYGLLIALVAQIHIFCEGIAAALFLEWFWAMRHNLKTRNALALFLPPFSALLAFLQVAGAFRQSAWTSLMPAQGASFGFWQRLHAQLSEMSGFWMDLPMLWTGAIPLFLLLCFTLALPRNKKLCPILMIWLVGALWMFACTVFLWMWAAQRTALLLYLAFFVSALIFLLHPHLDRRSLIVPVAVSLLSLSTYWAGFHWLWKDIHRPAASFQQVGRFLQKNYPPGQIVICHPGLSTQLSAFAPELAFFNLQNGERQTYYDASKKALQLPPVSVNELMPIILEKDCPLVFNRLRLPQFAQRFPEHFPDLRLECVMPFQDTLYQPDDLCVLVIQPLLPSQ